MNDWLVVLVVLLAAEYAAYLVGRASQRREHKPHWDELVRLRRKVASLRAQLADKERTVTVVVAQRNSAMEAYRRVRDKAGQA